MSLIPAILNYTRVDPMVACGVEGKRYSQYRDNVKDGQLSFGTRCKTIGRTLRDFPELEHAERTDMIEKTVRFADECKEQCRTERDMHGSDFNAHVWMVMQTLALQTALNLAS